MKNAQLWKRILNEGLDPDCQLIEPQFSLEDLQRQIVTSPIIVSCGSSDLDRELPDWADFSGMAVPFEKFWLETVATCEFDDGLLASVPYGVLVYFSKDDRLLTVYAFVGRKLEPPQLLGRTFIPLTEDFGVVVEPDRRFRPVCDVTGHLLARRLTTEEMCSMLTWPCGLLCENMMLLGCSNVSLAPRENDPAQTRRASKRFGGTPDSYRYHILVVRPAGAKANAPTIEVGTIPLHKCRGHQHHYGPAAIHRHRDGRDRGLLFGKYAGRFYIPPHERGDKKNGVVEKDYEIPAA